MAGRGRSAVSTYTAFAMLGPTHVHAPIQMHDVITSPKSKNKIYQTTRRQYIWRRTVRLHCLFTDYSFTVKRLPTSLTKAVRRLVESPYSLTPYQSTRRHYHIHISHFIPWLSTQLRTAFFREVASSVTRRYIFLTAQEILLQFFHCLSFCLSWNCTFKCFSIFR